MFQGTYFSVELVTLFEELWLKPVPQEMGRLRKSRAACGPPSLMSKLTATCQSNRLHRLLSSLEAVSMKKLEIRMTFRAQSSGRR